MKLEFGGEIMEDKCICYDCKRDKIPSGCNTSVKDYEVIKGVGVVSCKCFELGEHNYKKELLFTKQI